MTRSYKSPSGRIIQRRAGGQFRKTTLRDFGITSDQMADGDMTCAKCGHTWHPILKTGYCPKCGSAEKVTPVEAEIITAKHPCLHCGNLIEKEDFFCDDVCRNAARAQS